MKLNINQEERDEIIFSIGSPIYSGGVAHFKGLSHEKLQELVDKNFAEVDDTQNSAPSLGKFLEFMKNHPSFLAHGYVVNKDREDYRVSIEGLEGKSKNEEEMKAFVELQTYPDEFESVSGEQWCWYD
jgi:hypothetical protein